MKAITIQQPWATLIALGEKRFETRSRRTHVRGNIAIHAGKKIDKEACEREPIKSTLAKHGYTVDNLPTGAVVAIADLVASHKVIAKTDKSIMVVRPNGLGDILLVGENELEFGFYEEGRHAWELSNVKAIEPINAKGQQGWWAFNYKLEHELLQPGDKVVMHTCLEADHYKDKVWTCESQEFRTAGGAYVVFLEGFSGYFSTEFLNKVEGSNKDESTEKSK